MSVLTPAEQTQWRTHPRVERLLAYIYDPPVVFSALVDGTEDTYPTKAIKYKSGVGDYTDIVPGQTIRISDSSGNIKGFCRVRKEATATRIPIGQVSAGELTFNNNDQIAVLDDFRLWAKIPQIDPDGTMRKDFEVYTDQTDAIPPVCVAGPHRIKLVNPDTDTATFSFDLWESYALAQGATISSFSANLKDCTVVSGSVASGIFTISAPRGTRWIFISVTDSNGKTHTRRVFVAAVREEDCIPVLLSTMDGDETGWTATFEIPVSSPEITEGALAFLFLESTPSPVGQYDDCSHIVFVGWVSQVTERVSTTFSSQIPTDRLEVTIENASRILDRLGAYDQTVKHKTTPTKWTHLKGLNTKRMLHYLLNWHSTALDVCDFEQPNWSYRAVRLDVERGSLLEQCKFVANAGGAGFCADKQSRLYARLKPYLLLEPDRSDLTPNILTLTDADWYDQVNIRIRHGDRLAWLRSSAIVASNTEIKAVMAIAPGPSPAQGNIEEQFDRMLVSSQSELNTRTGQEFAKRNSEYGDFEFQILNNPLVVDPAWGCFVVSSLPAESNRYGLSITNGQFEVLSVHANWDVESSLMKGSWVTYWIQDGQPAKKVKIPKEKPLPPVEKPPDPYVPPSPEPPPFLDTTFYVLTDAAILRTRQAAHTDTVWELILTLDDFPNAESFVQLVLDAWYPADAAYVLTNRSTGVIDLWYITNLDAPGGGQTVTLLRTLNSDTKWAANVVSSINVPGGVAVAYYNHSLGNGFGGKVKVDYRDGYAAAWRTVTSSQYPSLSPRGLTNHLWRTNGQIGLWLGHHWDGGVDNAFGYLNGNASAVDRRHDVVLNTDRFVTLGSSSTQNTYWHGSYSSVQGPYSGNASDVRVYAARYQNSEGAVPTLWYRDASGVWTDITPSGYYDAYEGQTIYFGCLGGARDAILCSTYNQDMLTIVGGHALQNVTWAIWRTTNAGASWSNIPKPTLTYQGSPPRTTTLPTRIWGWPYDDNILILGVEGYTGGTPPQSYVTHIPYTVDGGTTWYNMWGNMSSLVSNVKYVANVAPVWTT
ncbi:MAG: hypothetical protein QXS68_03090 [Candidatus Methanomethylicaceae archaeon]